MVVSRGLRKRASKLEAAELRVARRVADEWRSDSAPYEITLEEVHDRRGRVAQRHGLPYLEDVVEWLAAGREELGSEQSPVDPVEASELRALLRAVTTRQKRLASRLEAVLLADRYTMSCIVGWLHPEHAACGDGRLHKLLAKRLEGDLPTDPHRCDIDGPEAQQIAVVTYKILRRLLEHQPTGRLSPEDMSRWVTARHRATQRVDLIEQIRHEHERACDHEAACQRLLRQRTPTARPMDAAGADEPNDAAAVQFQRQLEQRESALSPRVADLSEAYTATTAELKAWSWLDLRRLLTQGTPTDDEGKGCPGYSKQEVRRLLGVLKLVKGQTDPATGATMVRKTVVAEAALRQEIVSLLQHRDCLADPEQAVAFLDTLRLEETLEWASERWDELGPLVAANALSEHAILLAALALLNIAPDGAPRRPEPTERGS